MPSLDYLMLVLGMGFVTYIPRWFPLFWLSQRRLPRWLTEWLDLIPAAILSALLFPELFTTDAPRSLSIFQNKALVALPTFWFALKTRSLGGTVVIGMLLFWLSKKFL